jgi:hypothetical protein
VFVALCLFPVQNHVVCCKHVPLLRLQLGWVLNQQWCVLHDTDLSFIAQNECSLVHTLASSAAIAAAYNLAGVCCEPHSKVCNPDVPLQMSAILFKCISTHFSCLNG